MEDPIVLIDGQVVIAGNSTLFGAGGFDAEDAAAHSLGPEDATRRRGDEEGAAGERNGLVDQFPGEDGAMTPLEVRKAGEGGKADVVVGEGHGDRMVVNHFRDLDIPHKQISIEISNTGI